MRVLSNLYERGTAFFKSMQKQLGLSTTAFCIAAVVASLLLTYLLSTLFLTATVVIAAFGLYKYYKNA